MIDTLGLSAADLTAAILQSSSVAMSAPDVEQDAFSGERETVTDPATEEPVAEETAAETPAVEEAVTPAAPVDEENDDIDPASLVKHVGQRLRVTARDENEAQVLLLVKRNKDMTLAEAMDKVYGKRGAETPAAITETAAAEPVVSPLETMENEMDELAGRIAEAKKNYDVDAEAALDLEYRKLTRSHSKLLLEATRAPAAKAPAPEATQTPAVDTAHQTAFDADWQETCANYPDVTDTTSPQRVEMDRIHAELVKTGDPVLQSPNLNSIIATRAAKALKIAPSWAKAPAARAKPAPVVPGPAKTGAQRSDVAPVKVDNKTLLSQLSPLALRIALQGGV